MAVARSFEIREALSDDYYLINHGTGCTVMVLDALISAVREIFEGSKADGFHFFSSEQLKSAVATERDLQWFKDNMRTRGKCDEDYSGELIAGDCYLLSDVFYESALYFFCYGNSMKVGSSHLKFWCDVILTPYITEEEKRLELAALVAQMGKELSGAALYSIAIPKRDWSEFGYVSGAYGVVPPKDLFTMADLDYLQATSKPSSVVKEELADRMAHWRAEDPTIYKVPFPQARLLARTLTPENGVHIFRSSSLSDRFMDTFRERVHQLVQQSIS